MSDIAKLVLNASEYQTGDPKSCRAFAVAAALEVIAAKASGADATNLRNEMGFLSQYADQIQEALKK